MKSIVLILLIILGIGMLWGQEITGDWHGVLEINGMKIRIVFHIKGSRDKLSATFDSPDQGAFGLPVSSISFVDSVLTMESTTPPLTYIGTLKNNAITGVFEQYGTEFPLNMQREAIKKPTYNRPQEPKMPYPYREKSVKFKNKEAGIKLAGTLTLPKQKGVYPAVILISGSGPQDRNEDILGHKPFMVIADYLTRLGVAVLRYDDRGVGKSGGKFSTATSHDFASDVKSAVKYLQSRKDIGRIGLIGHSEGGLIAPLVAVDMPSVEFIVLLAGTGIRGDKLLLLQEELIWRVDEPDEDKIQKSLYINRNIFDIILNTPDNENLGSKMRKFLEDSIADSLITIPEGYSQEDLIGQYIEAFNNPWMLTFIMHDPAPTLQKVKCAVLAVNGSKDLQVPADINLQAIESALKQGENPNFLIHKFEGLNHLFQECDTGHPKEYAEIEQTFSPKALEAISQWILQQTEHK